MTDRGRILEVLKVALRRLENPRAHFDFGDWTSCTCGHIYAASHGRKTHSGVLVATARDERFADIIQAVARALGWDGEEVGTGWGDTSEIYAVAYVSDYTAQVADEIGEDERDAAILLLRQAIRNIETLQERDRLDVLAQMRTVADSWDTSVAEGVAA